MPLLSPGGPFPQPTLNVLGGISCWPHCST